MIIVITIIKKIQILIKIMISNNNSENNINNIKN